MAPNKCKAVKASIQDRIDILRRNSAEDSPATGVILAVRAIQVLVLTKMINNDDSVQLSEYCFNVSETLKTMIQGKGLSESVVVALDDLRRAMNGIERALRRGVNMSRIKYDKDGIERRKLEIEGILNTLTCGWLIRREFAPHELPSLIEAILVSEEADDTIHHLPGDDAQTFVDVINETLDRPDLSPPTREKCLKLLYRACGHHALLPRALKIPVRYDPTGAALYSGGYADVWKGEHCGRDVAVKVIRTYWNSDLRMTISRFCKEVVTWKSLQHPNVLPLIGVTMSGNQFTMVSDWMANGNINDFVKAHPGANRLELLGDVARGLIYIHNQGVIHGDLKGANIVIDRTAHARLADFGLFTIVSDPANTLSTSPYTQSGVVRWLSPELIAPQDFGFKSSCPTKYSDCYSLGMVTYEVISGNTPFYEHADLTVFMKISRGESPSRGGMFTKGLWEMLQRCWASRPNTRPSVEDVLQCLETSPNFQESPFPGVDEGTEQDGGSERTSDRSSPVTNILSDRGSESRSRSSSVSSYTHYSSSPSPIHYPELPWFHFEPRVDTPFLLEEPSLPFWGPELHEFYSTPAVPAPLLSGEPSHPSQEPEGLFRCGLGFCEEEFASAYEAARHLDVHDGLPSGPE